MPDLIVRLLKGALTICGPTPRGGHRATDARPRPSAAVIPQLPRFDSVLDGSASAFVRPYLLGNAEAHLERRRQRERRRSLYLATWGIDIGAHRIHGVQVATG